MRNKRRPHGVLTLLLGFIALGLCSQPALADWGMGYGWGWGGFGFHNAPSPTNFLNQHALTRAAAGSQAPPSRTPLANNPNAYFNRLRDPGFVSHYDARRRQPPSYRPEPTRSLGNSRRAEAQPAADTSAPNPIAPLASFFDASQTLVWPNESPTGGDLKEKRVVSDQAALAVLEETKRQSVASISSVTHARQKLIAYGQPALREIRAQTTAVIADTFHRFMLSLYDSLAQASWPPDAIPGSAPDR